jgi:hypothetical protein
MDEAQCQRIMITSPIRGFYRGYYGKNIHADAHGRREKEPDKNKTQRDAAKKIDHY